ncbi:ABC transporter ATP-binding protein [Brachybacterium sp. GU-2]|uniref:ABC transporter ATP-binding protein n=1 Tax=Brachybacterium sp. GU-2 TaxID=3069708 RepID=UPI00280BF39E|nr:ATP-binding cassette domain-containing protein [Brachybacterium sp. GU-2]WME23074.1 ATP-binding cassette domain-containing protein [Brachybacterium sp. GU-2]
MHITSPAVPPGAVVAEDVSKVFFSGTDPVWALEDFSLTLEPGSFTCIVGPSGCGKSTFLRILGGLEERTVGSVTMPAEGHRIPAAFVFQEHGVFPWMTVRENVAFGLRMTGTGTAERRRIADDWLARVRLSDFADSYPHQLSGGMRQRVAIARAFATGSPCCSWTSRSAHWTPRPACSCRRSSSPCGRPSARPSSWSPTTSTRRSSSPTA